MTCWPHFHETKKCISLPPFLCSIETRHYSYIANFLMVEAARSNLEHSCSWNKRQFQIGLTQGRLQWHHQYLIYSVPVHIHHLEAQEERAIIWQILITMSDLEKACGDVNVAQNLRDQARAIVNDIAEDAGEMQDVFFSQPAVVQLLGK